MNEAQRFLRYILPGLIFIVEFLGYLLISGNLTFGELRAWVKTTDNTTGIVIGAFLGSGAIGFLLSVLHYRIFWIFDKTGVNHCSIFEIAESRKWLKLVHADERREVRAAELTKRGAYRVVTTYLIRRSEACKKIKGVIPRTERLADLVNA